jgi:hypothetical protein
LIQSYNGISRASAIIEKQKLQIFLPFSTKGEADKFKKASYWRGSL